ncbi:MAG: pyridoxal phosphate-dependent aminotransferase [Deltaproteobacteria bacterium]|nr:pyridoxal phosphate-dependent aminotransferase [Deltaproteobacteria bacterium]
MGVSCRAKDIPPFLVMDVLEHAQALEAQGRRIIHLEVGEPDFDTPECIKEAAIRAMREGHTHYTHSLGLVQLRQAISDHYAERYGVDVDPARILVTSGTSPAMLLMFSALLEAGQEIIVSDPGYACYQNFISFVGGVPVPVVVAEEDAFQYTPEAIRAHVTPRTKGVVINSPANPTGQLLSPERMAAIAELAPGRPGGPYVISDEIYHGLVYQEGREHSILEYTPDAFVLNGFSKLYAMTGWRLGYLIAPAPYVRPLQKMHQNFAICAPSVAQWAGLAALTQAGPDVERMRLLYDQRRQTLIKGLKELGFAIPHEPTGAFYVLTSCKHLDPDDMRLAFHILDQAGVAVTPGRDFGQHARGHLRFSYCNSLANIQEGLHRLKDYLSRFYGC